MIKVKEINLVRLIDKKSYSFFLFIYVVGILLCSLLFYLLSYFDNGIVSTVLTDVDKVAITYFDSLYFSLVTISSLGYGDFRPIGYGRIVAMMEVTYGLIIIALIVSKLASERTSTLVRLLYTSDVQKRVQNDINRINTKNNEFTNAIRAHDYEKIYVLIEDFLHEYYAYAPYIIYQKKDGLMEGKWADKLFLKLLRSIKNTAELTCKIAKLSNITEKERKTCTRTLFSIKKLVTLLGEEFDDPNIFGLSNHINKYIDDTLKSESKVVFLLTEKSPELISKVKQELPKNTPWERNIHKKIAAKLRISNRLSHEIILEIINKKDV